MPYRLLQQFLPESGAQEQGHCLWKPSQTSLPARRPSASSWAPLTCFQSERQSNPNLFHLLLPAHLLPQQWDLSAHTESRGSAPSLSVFRIKKLNKSPQGQSLTLRKEVVNVESRTGCDSWLISPGDVGYLRTFTRLKLWQTPRTAALASPYPLGAQPCSVIATFLEVFFPVCVPGGGPGWCHRDFKRGCCGAAAVAALGTCRKRSLHGSGRENPPVIRA